MTDIEGELADKPTATEIALRDQEKSVQVFNPLDAEPVQFSRALVSRSENYDVLALHLRGILVAGKDFGRIHIANKNKCPSPWHCSYELEPYHYSPMMLFSQGADKVLGILGLGVTYPDEQDYRRATLKGMVIQEVIIKCFVDNGRGQVISEGMGAATRSQEGEDLNRTIKKAIKRARMDAVLRLPSISALFEEDWLEQVDKDQATKKNSTMRRGQQISGKHNTGASLSIWPLKGKLEGQKFADMDEGALRWICENFDDKPDIKAAAVKVLESRQSQNGAPDPNDQKQQPDADQPPADDDWMAQYDNYPEAQ